MSEENLRLFESLRDHLNEIDIKTSEQFDRAILTLSSTGLALSVGLTNFIVPFESATSRWLMFGSWVLLLLAIISTVVSFLTAKSAVWDTREYAQKYYIEDLEEFGTKISPWSRVTYWLNLNSAVLFIMGALSITLFIAVNVPAKEATMAKDSEVEERGHVPTTVEPQGPKVDPPKPKPQSDGDKKSGS